MPLLLAVDPGRQKVGIALLEGDGKVRRRAVVSVLSLESDGAQRVVWSEEIRSVGVLGPARDRSSRPHGVPHGTPCNCVQSYLVVRLECLHTGGRG